MTATCPITGEPLLNPGQTVAQSALQNLRAKTNDVADLMARIGHRIAGAGRPERTVTSHTIAGSKPPISLGLLDLVDDHRDTISIWAFHIMHHVNPTWRMPRANDWTTIQAIYQQHLLSLTQWEYAPTMIDEVNDAIDQLRRIEDPPPTPINVSADDLVGRYLTLDNALLALELNWGRQPKASTVRSWIHRGKLTPTKHQPPRYLIADLLRLTEGA